MENCVFIAGFCSDILDCLATYEITKDVKDITILLEYTAPKLPNTKAENLIFCIITLVRNAVNTGVLTIDDKQKITHKLDILSEDLEL